MPKELVYKEGEIKRRLDGRSLKWLAEKSGIAQRRIYKLANGECEPTASEIAAISSVLNMKPLDSLVTAA